MALQDSQVEVVLLDIGDRLTVIKEGTVCPISFVKDVLIPYALRVLPSILATEWDSPTFLPYRNAFPTQYRNDPTSFSSHIHDLTTRDIKAPYLKSLQGHLWQHGYLSGALRCPLFSDVLPSLQTWTSSIPPITILIYSSGSIAAQKLLFQHTLQGDITRLLSGYFDTTTAGPKTEPASYKRICEIWGLRERSRCLFLSDRVDEVRAAREAGLVARLVLREGNDWVELEVKRELGAIESFEEVFMREG